MDLTLSTFRALTKASLLLLLFSCDQRSGKLGHHASDPKACGQLAAQLCKGSDETLDACRSTLDLLTPQTCTSALASVSLSLDRLAARRKQCDDLTAKLCKDLGPETQTCAMVKDSSGELSATRCETMLRDYDNVLAELRRQEESSKPLSAELQAKLTRGNPPAFGPVDAKVTIVEFSDFQCPYCARAAEAVHIIRAKYGDKVRMVFRQYPLSFHEHAELCAQASLAAQAQGKFWELHDKLFENQGQLDRASIEHYAQEIGLDLNAFKQALDDEQYKSAVDAELELGEQAAVDGTPTLFINGQRFGNPTNAAAVSGAIEVALAKSKS